MESTNVSGDMANLQRAIDELKTAINKLSDNHNSLLEMLQQNKHVSKALQENVDNLSENLDDVKTTVCRIGSMAEDALKRAGVAEDKAEEGLKQNNALQKRFDIYMADKDKEITLINNEFNCYRKEIDKKIYDAFNAINSNKLATDKIANSFGGLLSKSNQALDCIDKVQDHLTNLEKEVLENRQDIEVIGGQLNKIKKKQKKKSKNITLVIK